MHSIENDVMMHARRSTVMLMMTMIMKFKQNRTKLRNQTHQSKKNIFINRINKIIRHDSYTNTNMNTYNHLIDDRLISKMSTNTHSHTAFIYAQIYSHIL